MQREIVRYAAGQHIDCPQCGAVLDAAGTVVLTHGEHSATLCARCYGHPIGSFTAGAVEVLDGRALWKPSGRSKRALGWGWKA